MYDAPIMMYGPRGWADLDDYRVVRDDDEAKAAARDGYFRAGEEAQEDLVAAGKWTGSPYIAQGELGDNPIVSEKVGIPTINAPKRRGRPPKA